MIATTTHDANEQPPMFFEVPTATKPHVRSVVAMAVISRLQEWCVQLFWMTLLCVVGACEEKGAKRSRDTAHPSKKRRLEDIEMKLLRHLTSPQHSVHRARSTKRRPASRPPSPQLFDIREEEE